MTAAIRVGLVLFFCTTLDILHQGLGVKTVVVAGVAVNICVLFTANDAYMRDLRVIVPSDYSAENTEKLHRETLQQMAEVLKADIRSSEEIQFEELISDATSQKLAATHPA